MPSPVVEAVDPYLALLERFRELHERIERHMAETDRKIEVAFAARNARWELDREGVTVVYSPDGVTPRWTGTAEEVAQQIRADFYGTGGLH